MARDQVKRNVVDLCEVPKGQAGRPSKSLTLDQARALLEAAEDASLYAYVVVSLLTGARTEELRALQVGSRRPGRPSPRQIRRSAVAAGLALGPGGRRHQDQEVTPNARLPATMRRGTPATPATTRSTTARRRGRSGSKTDWSSRRPGAPSWTRPTSGGLPPGDEGRRTRPDGVDAPGAAAQLRVAALRTAACRSRTSPTWSATPAPSVTEKVYRHQLRPVLLKGAVAMDRSFRAPRSVSHSVGHSETIERAYPSMGHGL